jgi:hypothetical protein
MISIAQVEALRANVLAQFDALLASARPRPSLGIYCDHINTSGVAPYTAMMGRAPDRYLIFTGNRDWSDYLGSIPWLAGVWKAVPQPLVWSVPMFAIGGNLADAAAGKYDTYWTKAAQAIIAARGNEETIAVRLAWEFNGTWYAWKAGGQEAVFAAAFARMAGKFRAVSSKFLIHWCPSLARGDEPGYANVDLCWPGDAHVDVVALDAYYFKQWDSADPVAAFAAKRKAKWGLDWLVDFAVAYQMPFGIDEWGVDRDSPAYLDLMAAWMGDTGCAHQFYWNSNGGNFAGRLDQYPAMQAAYRKAFG